jgi:hypothetical protein
LLTNEKFPKLVLVSALFFNPQKMSSTPFRTMKAIYVYIAALIGLVVVSTGVYGLLEYIMSILFLDASFDAAYIITPLTRIITGLFIMVPHWGIGHHFHLLENKRKK